MYRFPGNNNLKFNADHIIPKNKLYIIGIISFNKFNIINISIYDLNISELVFNLSNKVNGIKNNKYIQDIDT